MNRVPFLKVKAFERVTASVGVHPDWIMEVEAKERDWTLAVIDAKRGQPLEVRNRILFLDHFLKNRVHGGPSYGVVVAPFLSSESARLCLDSGIGYADLAGNAHLSFDQVFIELQEADNPFRVKRHLRSLFTAKAGRVLRVLLTPPMRAWKVTELAVAAGVSLGQVSNVRRLLLDREWAVANDAGVHLTKPETLAEAWRSSYEMRPLSREASYTLLHGEALEDAVRRAFAEAGNGSHAVLASYSAAAWIAPFARQATQFFYADKQGAAILKSRLQLQPVLHGENVVLLEPHEDDVFSARTEAAPGIWCSGMVQTWLDLNVAGERGAEAAEHLLNEKLLPAWRKALP